MLTYFNESDEIKMDVQVGPQEEVEAKVEGEECCCNPVDAAKKDPSTVPVGCCVNKQTGVKEFYVDAADVAKLAELNEMTMLEALDEIIDVNEGSDMRADNIVVVMSEGTEMYERNLERNGAACVHFNESMSEAGESGIEMDVQVGPNSEDITVSEDPQEANPVDAVKRQYDSVVVAKDGDKFFMDVEDVQKCAELNCESVIDTLNGIIDVHEGFDMNTGNVVVIVDENTSDELCAEFGECGVMMEAASKKEGCGKKSINGTKIYIYHPCDQIDTAIKLCNKHWEEILDETAKRMFRKASKNGLDTVKEKFKDVDSVRKNLKLEGAMYDNEGNKYNPICGTMNLSFDTVPSLDPHHAFTLYVDFDKDQNIKFDSAYDG